ncbi:MAG TPA: hypothetical protein VGN95_25330 [Pyrinomonadaceae bacterium]|jgi:hypothetical protein|nr:hypothetical protein [Pyrinomonadaceae bacterium]
MLTELWGCCKAIWRFRDYKPQPVTYTSINKWLQQFDKEDHKILLDLLNRVIYVTEEHARDYLVKRNKALLAKLSREGISLKKIIYMQIDDAGSSSAVMLNMLKESALLERQPCTFLDSKDIKGLNESTNKLGEGAIIYVDDFIGSGEQFCRSRDFAAEFVIGTFSEFLLAPCICEEALYKLGHRGIEACAGFLHSINERPLHEYGSILDPEIKDRLLDLGKRLGRKGSLGYKQLATMVVFYRNAPNSVPWLLRGNIKQEPYVGVLPRTTDLPPIL